jgi:hypothetical protein
VGEYIDDILLVLSVIGAPIVLGMLLFYGMTITERRHHDADAKKQTDDATRDLYAAAERERRAKEKSVGRSDRPLDLIKHRTGTSA